MSEARGRIGFEDFIEAWETSDSVQNVCDKLDISKQNAYARATKYRSDGVPLQKFVGGGGRAKVSLEEKLAVLARVRGTSIEELHLESQEMLVSKENEAISTENQEHVQKRHCKRVCRHLSQRTRRCPLARRRRQLGINGVVK